MKNSVVVDAQSHAVRVCELDQRFAFAASKGERLFDEDMQPGRQRFSGDFEMVRRRNQDMDYLRPAAAEELGDRGCRHGDAPLMRQSVQPCGVWIASPHHACRAELT